MEFILTNILGRGNSPNDPSERDVEDQREHPRREDGSGRGVASRFLRRPQLPSIRLRRNSGDAQQARTTTVMNEVDSPKTPIFQLGAPSLPSTRLHLPHLNRTWTRDSTDGPSPVPSRAPSNANGRTPRPSMQQSRARPEENENVALPEPVRQGRDSGGRRAMRRFRGADPAEVHLANLAETGRRRARRRGSGDDASQPDAEGRGKPKRFMYCFPPIKSRRIRKQIVRCLISGFFLTLLLSIYLALSLTKNINQNEFTILLILIILFATIFFCHALIRLCMFIVRPRSEEDEERSHLPQMYGPGGYAIPRRPIRVVLARDEEAAGLESETTKLQPPAYGLWRESVRVDPNRIFWQRNDQAPAEQEAAEARPTTANRPPSYISDDGVDYVVEARPRSVAPLSDVPLPPHPSEVGRVARRPNN